MKITRRSLLVASGASAALAIGWVVWPRRHGAGWTADVDEHVLNAFVKLGKDGRVTVAVPQAEMGQGIWSGLAQILASELGADWKTVAVEPAPLGPDYANRGMTADMTAEMSGAMRAVAEWAAGRVVQYFDLQVTGGSTSVRGFEAPLRAAGAVAREMLCRAAARRWNVSWTDCDTANGFVTHKANRLAFADVAAEAAQFDPPSSPTLREGPGPYLSGQSVLRLDIPSKTDGTAIFGADVRLPGMMYAAIAQGPIGAKRLGINRTRLPVGCRIVEQPGFVAVVADGWWAARTGLEALEIRYSLPANPAGPWIEASYKGALENPGTEVLVEGDATAVLDAPGTLSADYTLPFLAHACMEPMTATARIKDGKCEIWAPTQSASFANWAVARTLGLEETDVTIFPTLLGGGFGRKVEHDAVVQAALIAKAVDRPVQLIWSREEDFGHDVWRPAVAARVRGLARSGTDGTGIDALEIRLAAPDISAGFAARNAPAMAGDPKASAGALEGAGDMPYAIEAIRLEHALVESPVPLGFWRSVGHSYTSFICESFIDELAHAAGAEPGAFRLALLKDQPRHAAVLRAAINASGGLGREEGENGRNLGRGVALWSCFGSIVAQVAEVETIPNQLPRVTQVWAAIDCGRMINPDSVRAQVESGIIYGLTAALHGRASFQQGEAEQRNFDASPLVDLATAPRVEVVLIRSTEAPGGVGEPGTPPIAPAVANAVFAASGLRVRSLPFQPMPPSRTGTTPPPNPATEPLVDSNPAANTPADTRIEGEPAPAAPKRAGAGA